MTSTYPIELGSLSCDQLGLVTGGAQRTTTSPNSQVGTPYSQLGSQLRSLGDTPPCEGIAQQLQMLEGTPPSDYKSGRIDGLQAAAQLNQCTWTR